MKMLLTICANDESIAPIGWPIVPLFRVVPGKRRDRDQQAHRRKPAPQDSKPKPG